MYEQLCTAPAGHAAWPAQNGGPDVPGPFERGFKAFLLEAEARASAAVRKRVTTCTWPSLWETIEVHAELDELADALQAAEATEGGPEPTPADAAVVGARADRLTVDEYYAMRVTVLVKNFDGIAAASHEKPKRRVDDDAHVKEEPLFWEGGDADGRGLDQVEAADEVAKAGLAKLGATATLAHRFEPDEMRRIMAFDTRERTTAYSKELLDTLPGMREGSLPSPSDGSALERQRKVLREHILEVYGGLAGRTPDGSGLAGGTATLLSRVGLRQQEHAEQGRDVEDDDVEAPPEVVAAPPAQRSEQVAHLHPPTGVAARAIMSSI